MYLPRCKNTDFNELKCPFGCDIYYPTKAALQRHRVRMHKYRRTPKDLPTEQFEYVPQFADIAKILRRANNDSREFIVETTKGTFEWRTLPLDHDKVKEFLEKGPEDLVILPEGLPLVNLERWAEGGELILDSPDEGSSHLDNEMDMSDQ